MKKIAVIGAALLLGSCYNTWPRHWVRDSHLPNISRIGVVSLLEEHFHGIHIGRHFNANKRYVQSISHWNIKEFIEGGVVGMLSKEERYSPSRLQGVVDGVSDVTIGSHRKKLIALARSQNLDTLIVVQDFFSDTAQFHKNPFGFYQRISWGGVNERCVYSYFAVYVIDVKSSKLKAWDRVLPCFVGDEKLVWKDNFDDYSSNEKSAFRSKIESQITVEMNRILKWLRLVDYPVEEFVPRTEPN